MVRKSIPYSNYPGRSRISPLAFREMVFKEGKDPVPQSPGVSPVEFREKVLKEMKKEGRHPAGIFHRKAA